MANDNVKNMVKQLVNGAKSEINEEESKDFTDRIKLKLRALKQAQYIVKNIEAEITDLEIAIAEKLS